MDPEAYMGKINSLGLGTLKEMKVHCKADAEKVLRQTRDFQKRLNQIKREINLEMKSIRAEYKERRMKAGESFSGVLSLVGQRKLAGSARADAKRQVTKERNQMLVQYDKIKLHIDSLLTQLNRLKMQLADYIQNAKTEEKELKEDRRKEEDTKSVCPHCGIPVHSSDNFCPSCGQSLFLP
ncbi:MAG: zinc-ribbon domain-containing protein [Theionarchaea archaeon]|nr:zinc-ribbon domain-containing protein [Theionarchaea archaeon]